MPPTKATDGPIAESRPQKRVVGRPPHQPTPEITTRINTLATVGLPESSIAKFVGLDVKTLNKYYSETIRSAMPALLAKSVANVVKALNSRDEGRAWQSSVFVLKTQGKEYGWSEHYHAHPLLGLDVKKLTAHDFAELIALLNKAGASISVAQAKTIGDRSPDL